jgi:hypothetical protein
MKVLTGAFARIARALGVPYGTVYNRIKYGISREDRATMYPVIDQEIKGLEQERDEKVSEMRDSYDQVINSLKDARK